VSDYLHGYDADEQQRLVAQAAYWRDKVIVPNLAYRANERLLEIGCGVGAVLRVLAEQFRGVRVAGIDVAPAQIEFARAHLAGFDADLRVGDAARLPWPDASFDHVFAMWFLEHLRDAAPVLREAHRVLAPGGTITCIETDYASFNVWPRDPDCELVIRAQYEHFAAHGDAYAGRRIARLLESAGFADARGEPFLFAPATSESPAALRAHVEYIAGFVRPAIPGLAALGYDAAALARGVDHLAGVWRRPDGSMTHVVYRGRAVRG
jgi:ubiquinone/menaquinone biosynthesis C-methylase UbiE